MLAHTEITLNAMGVQIYLEYLCIYNSMALNHNHYALKFTNDCSLYNTNEYSLTPVSLTLHASYKNIMPLCIYFSLYVSHVKFLSKRLVAKY
jgi:hypothetical protein